MKRIIRFLVGGLLVLVCATKFDLPKIHAASTLEVYPGPGVNTYQSALYKVEVLSGTTWVPLYVYNYSRISNTHWHQNGTPSVNFTTFGTSGPVSVRASLIGGSITSVQVSPENKNIQAPITNGQAIFTLNPNDKAWITINGDDADPLFVFADPPKPAVPAGALYFGPGIYDISPATGDHYQAPTNGVIYLDGGAWVKGNIVTSGATNVQIMGPGVLSGEVWSAATVDQLSGTQFKSYSMIYAGAYGVTNNTTVQGVTIVNSPVYGIYGASSVSDVKILSPWSTQTDAFSAVSVDQSFAFNGDTVFHLEEPFVSASGAANVNLSVTNSFVGNTNNAVFLGGYWGNPSTDTFSASVNNVDIKTYNDNTWVPYGAPYEPSVFQLWVDGTSSAYGDSNQTYQNIRIEGNIAAPLAQLENIQYPWGGTNAPATPLGNSSNIVFKNIILDGTQNGLSTIAGWNASNGFYNVTLQNVQMGGTVLNQNNLANFFQVNPYVSNLNFGYVATNSAAPIISSFSASPSAITSGGSSALSWSTSNATSISITPGSFISTAAAGSVTISPTSTTSYTLTATNSLGTSTTQMIVLVTPAATIGAPTTPANLTATAVSSSQINLSWSPSTDTLPSFGYAILRNGTLVKTTTQTTFVDSGLTPATSYTYNIVAYDSTGADSKPSLPATATTLAIVPSSTISSFTASPAIVAPAGAAVLSWNIANASAITISPGSYSTSAATGSLTVNPTATTTYTITATNSTGAVTSQTTVTVGAPSTPKNLTATVVSPSQINLAWSPSTDVVTLAGYAVVQNGVVLAKTTQTSYAVTGLAASTTYRFMIVAYDIVNATSTPTTAVSATTSAAVPAHLH